MTLAEKEYLEKIENLKYVIEHTKSYKCKNDHIKALNKCYKELAYYRKHYYKGEN